MIKCGQDDKSQQRYYRYVALGIRIHSDGGVRQLGRRFAGGGKIDFW